MNGQDQANSFDSHLNSKQNSDPSKDVSVFNPTQNSFKTSESDQQQKNSPKEHQNDPKRNNTTELSKTNEPSDTLVTKAPDMSLLMLTIETLIEGFFGFVTYFLMIGFLFFMAYFLAHSPTNSALNLSVYYIILFQNCSITWFIFGFNSGCLIIFSRYVGIKDWKSLKIVFNHGKHCQIFYSLMYVIYVILIFICLPYIYPTKPEYVIGVRSAMYHIPIIFLFFPFLDLIRNLFIANGCLDIAVLIEFIGLVICVTTGWTFIINFDMHVFGVTLALGCTQIVTIGSYYGYFQFGSRFKPYREANSKSLEDDDDIFSVNKEDQKNLLIDDLEDHENGPPSSTSKDHRTVNSIGNLFISVKEIATIQQEENDLRCFDKFVKFTQWFGLQGFQNFFYAELFTLIVSEYYPMEMMDAQASLDSINKLVACIGVGYGFVISSKLSKFMAQNNTKQVKRMGQIGFTIMLTTGCMIGLLAYVYCDRLAAFLNKDVEVQKQLVKIIKFWAIYLPSNSIHYALMEFYKAINLQKFVLVTSILTGYALQFMLIVIFIRMGDGSECIWRAASIQISVFDLILMIGQFFVNLKKQSEDVAKSLL